MTEAQIHTAVIELPWPDKRLSPNARVHWAELAKVKKKARIDGAKAALAGGARKLRGDGVSVRLRFHPPDNRRRDTDNMLASCKAALDGVADAMLTDDSKWNLSIARGAVRKGGVVIARITEIGA